MLSATACRPAQTPAPLRLTLDEALARAMETSHRLAEGRARQQSAEATVEVRRKADDPTVTALAGYTRTNHVRSSACRSSAPGVRVIYPDIPDNFRTRLELAWPVYTAGRVDALARAAQAEATASGLDLETTRLDLRLEVARAYWALVTAREAVRVLEAGLATADRSLVDVRNRVEAGLLPPNDVTRSESQRARQELLLIEARGRIETTSLDLRRLIGEPDTTPDRAGRRARPARRARTVRPRRSSPKRSPGVPSWARSPPAPTASTRGSRPSPPNARPAVAVVSGVDYARPNPRIFPRQPTFEESWDVSLNLSWQFWDSGRAAAERTEAQFQALSIRERRADVETQVRADVQKQLVELASARAALVPARLAVTAAQETNRVLDDRFEAGVATTIDVLDAQVSVLQAELDRARVLAEIKLSEARLARVLGR